MIGDHRARLPAASTSSSPISKRSCASTICYGRRDNKYKARIKILVHELGAEKFRAEVEAEFAKHADAGHRGRGARARAHRGLFRPAAFETPAALVADIRGGAARQSRLRPLGAHQCRGAPVDGYAIVNISLKPEGGIPGDATADQMRRRGRSRRDATASTKSVSAIAQNLVLPHVKRDDLFAVWKALEASGPRHRQSRACRRHHRLPRPRLLHAGDGALDPDRAGDLAHVRRSRAAAGDRPAQDQHLRLHQCLRPSPCRPYRHSRPRQEGRGVLPDHARRLVERERLDRHRSWGRALPAMRCRRRSKRSSTPISSLRQPGEEFLDAYRRLGPQPFKEALYAAH